MYQLTDNPLQVIVLDGHSELPTGTRIHSKARFWAPYQEWLETGTPRPAKPAGFYEWEDEAWAHDAKAVALAELMATDVSCSRELEDIVDALLSVGADLPYGTLYKPSLRERAADKKAKRKAYNDLV